MKTANCPTSHRRRVALLGLIVPTIVLAATPTVRADPATSESCSPTPKVDSSFCLTAGVSVTAAGTSDPVENAASPIDLAGVFSNSSTHHDTDTTQWLKSLAISLGSGASSQIVGSATLPGNLLIAGAPSDCGSGSDFSSCTAGYGAIYGHITGNGTDTITSGSFGIQRIVNDAPSGGAYVDWQLTAKFCLALFGSSCFTQQSHTFELTAPQPSAGQPFSITLPATATFSTGGYTIVASIDTIHLNLPGRSSRLSDGTSTAAVTVARLPVVCGTDSLTVTAADMAGDQASYSTSNPATGCPTTGISGTATGRTVSLTATTPTSPVSGRTVASYLWAFGDGHRKSTNTPTVTHAFVNSADRKVTLVAVDSAGAHSAPVSLNFHGSTLTITTARTSVRTGTRLKLSGQLTRWHAATPLAHRRLTVSACVTGAKRCTVLGHPKTTTAGNWSIHNRPHHKTRYVVTYAGGGHTLGTTAHRTVSVTKH